MEWIVAKHLNYKDELDASNIQTCDRKLPREALDAAASNTLMYSLPGDTKDFSKHRLMRARSSSASVIQDAYKMIICNEVFWYGSMDYGSFTARSHTNDDDKTILVAYDWNKKDLKRGKVVEISRQVNHAFSRGIAQCSRIYPLKGGGYKVVNLYEDESDHEEEVIFGPYEKNNREEFIVIDNWRFKYDCDKRSLIVRAGNKYDRQYKNWELIIRNNGSIIELPGVIAYYGNGLAAAYNYKIDSKKVDYDAYDIADGQDAALQSFGALFGEA